MALLALLSVGLFLHGLPPATPVKEDSPLPPAQAEADRGYHSSPQAAQPASREAEERAAQQLNSELTQVLTGIRNANLEKNLAQLLSFYSPNFPRLTQRAQDISKSWKTYDYRRMEFTLGETKRLSDNHATARVTWEIEAQNITTLKYKKFSRTYTAKFIRESGRWRLSALEKAPN